MSIPPNSKEIKLTLRPPTTIAITLIDEVGGIGFQIAKVLAGMLLFDENPINRANYQTIYEQLNEMDKFTLDSALASLANNPDVQKEVADYKANEMKTKAAQMNVAKR